MNNNEASYKVWSCHYDYRGGWGAFQEYRCIVVAEIESKALGMALMEFPDTCPEDWSAYEIDITKENVHFISSASS